MTEIMTIHPHNPQPRMISRLGRVLSLGKLVVLPTDSGYVFACRLEQKEAADRIRRLRNLDKNHFFTLICRNFSQVSTYAVVNNGTFRFIKAHTPAPVTFVLGATREVPRRLAHPKRRTIGVRIPDHVVLNALLDELGEPIMTVSVEPSETEQPPLEVQAIYNRFYEQVELVVDDRLRVSVAHTTVVDLTSDCPAVIRQGDYQL